MWAPGPPGRCREVGAQALNPQLPLRREDVTASMQACLWHDLSLVHQRRLDHVMAGRLLCESILVARRQEKLRSVYTA